MSADSLAPFDLAAAELRKLGLDLTRLPGEYRVNFHNGAESTAQTAETIDAAIELGRAMAAERTATQSHSAGSRHRRHRRRQMTRKPYNKRRRMAHLGRMRVRARRKQRAETRSEE